MSFSTTVNDPRKGREFRPGDQGLEPPTSHIGVKVEPPSVDRDTWWLGSDDLQVFVLFKMVAAVVGQACVQ